VVAPGRDLDDVFVDGVAGDGDRRRRTLRHVGVDVAIPVGVGIGIPVPVSVSVPVCIAIPIGVSVGVGVPVGGLGHAIGLDRTIAVFADAHREVVVLETDAVARAVHAGAGREAALAAGEREACEKTEDSEEDRFHVFIGTRARGVTQGVPCRRC
jgi:hypothetical protein